MQEWRAAVKARRKELFGNRCALADARDNARQKMARRERAKTTELDLILTEEVLTRLHSEQGLSSHQIARQFNVSTGAVSRRIKLFGIKRKGA